MAGNGYATTSRKKILEYFMANSDRTVTVTDIDQYLKKHDNEVNITTIYRYLDKLAKEGTVMKYVAEKGSQAVYQYVEMGHHCEEHLHLKCVSCGCIIHLECAFMQEISEHILEDTDLNCSVKIPLFMDFAGNAGKNRTGNNTAIGFPYNRSWFYGLTLFRLI